jgi:endonuclease-3
MPASTRSRSVTTLASGEKVSPDEIGSTLASSGEKVSSERRKPAVVTPPKKRAKTATTTDRKAPAGWQDTYSLVTELRSDRSAPCDGDGCEALGDRSSASFRFHVLVSLMLSSQTKDAIVAEAVRSMKDDGVCSVVAISEMDPDTLNTKYLARVGFHNNKTKYLKQAVEILKEKYDGEIPPSAAEMMMVSGCCPRFKRSRP